MELGKKLYKHNKPEYYSINLKTAELLLNTLCLPNVNVEVENDDELLSGDLIEFRKPEVGISTSMISFPMDSVEFVSEGNAILSSEDILL